MSGLTPLLDTLLHHVLGRRAAPTERPLPEHLIVPVDRGGPAARAHSDSRLDPRSPAEPRTVTGRGETSAAAAPGRSGESTAASPRGALTRLSPAGRVIAALLAQEPDAPAVLRAATPLLASADAIDGAWLAAQLRASIESSGLFYEAHLLRWASGAFARVRLAYEPQMQWVGATVPDAVTPDVRTLPPAREGASGSVPAGGEPGVASGTEGRSGLDPACGSGADRHGVVAPALEELVRQQLVLLASPILRWEGVPWPGALLAMLVQPPVQEREPGRPRRHMATANEGWRTELRLRLPRLGVVRMALQLGDRYLDLEIVAPARALARLRAAEAGLRARIGALGVPRISVQLRADGRDGLDRV